MPLRRPPRPRLPADAAAEAPAAEAGPGRPPRLRPPTLRPPSAPASRADEGEFGADSAAPREDGSAPEGFEIKGNKTSKKFHAPSSPWYDRTNAEVWFRTAEAAEAAGFVNAESKSDASA